MPESNTLAPNRDAWLALLKTKVSGDAIKLALRLALEPAHEPPTFNVREMAESLCMSPREYELAHNELRDPRVGWIKLHHLDRAYLNADALPRRLFDGPPPVPAPSVDKGPSYHSSTKAAAMRGSKQ